MALRGVGTVVAATLLVVAGDNPERLTSEAAWAQLCGVAPLEASSGKVTRHRLNAGGDRQANSALWRIVIVRITCDPDTRAYVERRTKEGRSKREVIRILKRYVAREVYRRPCLATEIPGTWTWLQAYLSPTRADLKPNRRSTARHRDVEDAWLNKSMPSVRVARHWCARCLRSRTSLHWDLDINRSFGAGTWLR